MDVLSVDEAVSRLVDPARRYPAHYVELAPKAPGLYVWWGRMSAIFGVHGTRAGEGYVYYVGKASSAAGLRGRLNTHAHGSARRSTLRLTLAALGAGTGEVRRTGESKVALAPAFETELSRWIGSNMDVSWLEIPEPASIEREVVLALQPPLNLVANTAHSDYLRVKEARSAIRADAVG